MSGCAPGALPPTRGQSAGLPVAANHYTRMSASRGSACPALLPVEALQCRSLAYLQQCQHISEPYNGCPEFALRPDLPARHLCHTSNNVWLLNFLCVPSPGREVGTALTECSMGQCMRAHLSSCAWRPGCTFPQAVCVRAGSDDTLLTLPGHSQGSHDDAPGDDVTASTECNPLSHRDVSQQ